ncbi:MAG: ImmA/IrrE family metallo-endopeptidase [Chloroflexota bacterium]
MTISPEESAQAERERLGSGRKGPIGDLVVLLEGQAGIPIIVAQLGEDGLCGAYVVRRDVPFIMVNGSNHPVRARFTMAHEYGHHVLGHGQVLDAEVGPGNVDSARETEANRFAAEFLMPLEGVEWWLTRHDHPDTTLEVIVRLAREFGVSAQVTVLRLVEAKRLSARRRSEFDKAIAAGEHLELARRLLLPRRHDSYTEARHLQVRLPARTQTILRAAYRAGLITADQLTARLGHDPGDPGNLSADEDG